MFDKKKQKKLYKIARKANELYELIRENNDILNIDARTKLKSALNRLEKCICDECEYSGTYCVSCCRRNCHNYKNYGGKKEYWRNVWRKIIGKKN